MGRCGWTGALRQGVFAELCSGDCLESWTAAKQCICAYFPGWMQSGMRDHQQRRTDRVVHAGSGAGAARSKSTGAPKKGAWTPAAGASTGKVCMTCRGKYHLTSQCLFAAPAPSGQFYCLKCKALVSIASQHTAASCPNQWQEWPSRGAVKGAAAPAKGGNPSKPAEKAGL